MITALNKKTQIQRHGHITEIQAHKHSVCACVVCGQPDTRLYFPDVAGLLLTPNTHNTSSVQTAGHVSCIVNRQSCGPDAATERFEEHECLYV
jgi:hypothetical protein